MVIAVRLDGVLSVYDKNRGVTDLGRPIDGSKEFMRWLIEDINGRPAIEDRVSRFLLEAGFSATSMGLQLRVPRRPMALKSEDDGDA